MIVLLVSLVSAFTVFTVVAGLLSSHRIDLPRVDRQTSRRLAHSLNRGSLPPHGPDREPGVQMARSRAASQWTVAMFLSLAVTQCLLPRAVDDIDGRFFYAVGTTLLVASAMTLHQLLASRRALRHADDQSGGT